MNNKPQKRSEEAGQNHQQPGNLSSFNNRDRKRSAEAEDAETSDKAINEQPLSDKAGNKKPGKM